MGKLIVLAFVGLVAQLVDGSLGMAYGVTSTTLLLAVGIAPAAASASVHLSEVGTTLVSGVSHWKLGNVNWRTVRWMAIPGGAGAFLGAVVLSSISAEAAKPFVAIFLFGLGVYILVRFSSNKIGRRIINKTISGKFLAPLGLGAGFLDAAGGGGWGPISTPTLLSSGRMEPRKVVGTVDTSEFLVALCASAGFLVSLSFAEVPLGITAALLAGGVFAAPVAAWLVRRLHPRILGTAVAGIILITNARTLLNTYGVENGTAASAYLLIVAIWLFALALAISAARREPATASEAPA
ncbi:MAG TPA: sulfite exporter TauE/SafE family protein [Rubrobacteraceae bacterium]|nr:sulfite exporter TauE/SafE family protein [Rubrobacteraceae bacterium]